MRSNILFRLGPFELRRKGVYAVDMWCSNCERKLEMSKKLPNEENATKTIWEIIDQETDPEIRRKILEMDAANRMMAKKLKRQNK